MVSWSKLTTVIEEPEKLDLQEETAYDGLMPYVKNRHGNYTA